jgi:hypothetical protein
MAIDPSSSEVPDPHNYVPWVSVVLGLLVFVSRYWSPRGTFDVRWNLFVTGIVIMFASLATVIAHDGRSRRNYWSLINIAAGIWLLVSLLLIPAVERVSVTETVLAALIIVVALATLAIEYAQAKGREPTT